MGQDCQLAPPASAVLLVYARAALHSHLLCMQNNDVDSAEGNSGLRFSMRQLEDCLCKCVATAKVSFAPLHFDCIRTAVSQDGNVGTRVESSQPLCSAPPMPYALLSLHCVPV